MFARAQRRNRWVVEPETDCVERALSRPFRSSRARGLEIEL